jgi:Lysyl oxidase
MRRYPTKWFFGIALCTGLLVLSVAGPVGGAPRAGSGDLLPNLVAFETRNVSIGPETCDFYETTEQGAERCLRYDTIVANFGHGALELRYDATGIGTNQNLYQRIFRTDGTYRDIVADEYVLHPTHAHFHYANFAQGHIWKSNKKGKKRGKQPVRSGNKAGFCLIDIEDHRQGTEYDQEGHYNDLDTCFPLTAEGASLSQVNGLSVGWADVYGSSLTDQYIEVTGVRDGYYLLEVEVDPLDTVLELDNSDNSAYSLILIKDSEVSLIPRGARP